MTSAGPVDVAIVGAGIGGITAAIGFAQQGATVQVFERAPRLSEAGAGIWVPPNAMQLFELLGIDRDVKRCGVEIRCAELHDYRSGLLQTIPTRNSVGSHNVAILRQTLQQILAAHAAAATVHFGHELIGLVETSDYAVLQFSNSITQDAKIIVAADGIHSAARRILFPEAQLRYSGQTSWRAVVQFELPLSSAHKSLEIWAPGARFGYSSVSGDQVYWYATADAPPGQTEAVEQAKDRLIGMAGAFPPPIPEFVRATPGEAIIRTDLWDLPGLTTWHRGHVALLGDAAHAATPNLGQGGAQAVEDAWTLATVFRNGPDVTRAFAEYERRRMRRALSVVRRAWQLGRVAHLGGFRRLLRNVAIRATPDAITQRNTNGLFNYPLEGTE